MPEMKLQDIAHNGLDIVRFELQSSGMDLDGPCRGGGGEEQKSEQQHGDGICGRHRSGERKARGLELGATV